MISIGLEFLIGSVFMAILIGQLGRLISYLKRLRNENTMKVIEDNIEYNDIIEKEVIRIVKENFKIKQKDV